MGGPENGNAKLTLPFDDIARATLPIAGDKGANLGELPGPGCRCPRFLRAYCSVWLGVRGLGGNHEIESSKSHGR
jgi:hypothetical protein